MRILTLQRSRPILLVVVVHPAQVLQQQQRCQDPPFALCKGLA